MKSRLALIFCAAALLLAGSAMAQSPSPKEPAATPPASAADNKATAPDLTKQPTLYVVGYAHLDTQWRWEYPQTIREFLPNTMRDNFALFEKYPNYIFNFSGSRRYHMMKEYYPADYARLKQYVAAGRWFPSGSSVDENDVNTVNAESIFRQILYGTQFFRHEFGKTSAEYMLPDCFGFPASLPTILSHLGLKGFSTQKLVWGSAVGVPFNVGFWEGPDGRGVIGALNPGDYVGQVVHDLSKSPVGVDARARNIVDWPARVQANGDKSGLFVDYHYYGTGDQGGSPREDSVKRLEAIVTRGRATIPPPQIPGQPQPQQPPAELPEVQVGDGALKIISASAEQMFLDIKAEDVARLPKFKGDMLLTQHSAGSINSQTYRKRWNRKNELLADAAERASVAAMWLGARAYPQARLNAAWELVLGGQMHDNLPGTATPQAVSHAWNDDVIAMNNFAGVLESATEVVAAALDTRTQGTAIVVYNPLNVEREDVVEATFLWLEPGGRITQRWMDDFGLARVVGPDGKEVPSHLSREGEYGLKIRFLARVPAVGYAVYDVQKASSLVRAGQTGLKVSEPSSKNLFTGTLENSRYRVTVDANGDISSIFDKKLKQELLSAPARLAFQYEKPEWWPAWNMDWADRQKPPRAFVSGPAKVRVVENGPVRVALEITRESEGSRFVQTIRLAAGEAGNRIEFHNVIDWHTPESSLRAVFPLTASNPVATYNWDVGTIERGNNDPKKYEVPSHQWFDLTDKSGAFGVTVLSDCKYASDKPDDNTLRLTLLFTPGSSINQPEFSDQTSQDWGRHEFVYGLAAHEGDWRAGQTDWQAYSLNQPLIAFEAAKHAGALGKTFSLMSLSNPRVRVLALKKAEEGDDVVIRVVETDGKPAEQVRMKFAAPIVSARELNGQEQVLRAAATDDGAMIFDLGAYQPRTFALKLAAPSAKSAAPAWQAVTLPYDRVVTSADGARSTEGFDERRRTIPAELLPREIPFGGITFTLADAMSGQPNAVTAKGQQIALPAGKFTRVYVLAASADGDQPATFRIGDKSVNVTVQHWGGFIGQWDSRVWNMRQELLPPRAGSTPDARPRTRNMMEFTGQIAPGFIKRAPVAWFASHHHSADGLNQPYAYSYLFAHTIDVPAGATSITLPTNDKIRILAITVSNEPASVRPAQPLYDTLEREGN